MELPDLKTKEGRTAVIEKVIYRGVISKIFDCFSILVNVIQFIFLVLYCEQLFRQDSEQTVSQTIITVFVVGLLIERIVAVYLGFSYVDFKNHFYRLLFTIATIPGNTHVLFVLLYPYNSKKNLVRTKMMLATLFTYVVQSIVIFVTWYNLKNYCTKNVEANFCKKTELAEQNQFTLIFKALVAFILACVTWNLILFDLLKHFCCVVPYEHWKENDMEMNSNSLNQSKVHLDMEPKSREITPKIILDDLNSDPLESDQLGSKSIDAKSDDLDVHSRSLDVDSIDADASSTKINVGSDVTKTN
ncbi:hypothetical protein BC833DRAFT_588385 [Globomyces pollinis-pini]|nr:hypothetical protein BC833DRAFT_588385 [Globomyces pollinis-pini]